MGAVRIRWSSAARAAIVAVAALIALQALPSLLRPPEPPPLAEDVGLPRVVPHLEPAPPTSRFESAPLEDKGATKPRTELPGADVISSKPKRQKSKPPRSAPSVPAPVAPPPAPLPSPPPVVYEDPAPPPPAPPSDGSEEFAPR
ncbi:MAG TPA: hypothetical protein VFU16_06225 [Solirubrobacterales bacterium]|nr:hypothetical protein [Solirubrobacterales bacterium]